MDSVLYNDLVVRSGTIKLPLSDFTLEPSNRRGGTDLQHLRRRATALGVSSTGNPRRTLAPGSLGAFDRRQTPGSASSAHPASGRRRSGDVPGDRSA